MVNGYWLIGILPHEFTIRCISDAAGSLVIDVKFYRPALSGAG
jgi:hypothetical protein